MDFSLSEEQIGLQSLARTILRDQTANERLREIEQKEDRFDEALWGDLATAGLLGVAIGEACDGLDLGFESLCLLVQEVGATLAPVPVVPTLVSAALPIDRFGNDEQRRRLLPGVAEGTLLLSAALIEPGNELPGSPACVAEGDGDGWRLTGTKGCVPFANRVERVLVGARLDGGVAVFLLDPRAEGVELARQQTTAGEPQFELRMAGARVDAADLLVASDRGGDALEWIARLTTAATCSMAVGAAKEALAMTARYTAEREQFGVKIATFQAVGQRAADCYIDVQCLELLTQQAVSLLQHGGEALDALEIAKIWAGDVSHRVSHAAQHLHGGIGVDRDYPLFRYCLWAKQLELTLGGSAPRLAALGERIAQEYRA